jgi:excisionase family DNA binding protein
VEVLLAQSLITVRDAAQRLAVSASMVRKLLATGQLTPVRIGRCVRVRLEDIEALIAGTPALRATPGHPSEEDTLAETETFIDE